MGKTKPSPHQYCDNFQQPSIGQHTFLLCVGRSATQNSQTVLLIDRFIRIEPDKSAAPPLLRHHTHTYLLTHTHKHKRVKWGGFRRASHSMGEECDWPTTITPTSCNLPNYSCNRLVQYDLCLSVNWRVIRVFPATSLMWSLPSVAQDAVLHTSRGTNTQWPWASVGYGFWGTLFRTHTPTHSCKHKHTHANDQRFSSASLEPNSCGDSADTQSWIEYGGTHTRSAKANNIGDARCEFPVSNFVNSQKVVSPKRQTSSERANGTNKTRSRRTNERQTNEDDGRRFENGFVFRFARFILVFAWDALCGRGSSLSFNRWIRIETELGKIK